MFQLIWWVLTENNVLCANVGVVSKFINTLQQYPRSYNAGMRFKKKHVLLANSGFLPLPILFDTETIITLRQSRRDNYSSGRTKQISKAIGIVLKCYKR